MGGQEKRKDRKTQKSKSEEKVVGFSSANPKGNLRLTQSGTMD